MARPSSLQTRIQLKIDTEANWKKATNFVPLSGELIIYSADEARPFSRLKVGDGTHTVNALEFIDAGTVNGRVLEDIIQVYNDRLAFPLAGEGDNLYVNLANNQIYCWTSNGYTRIGGLTYTATSQPVNVITSWDAGSAASFNSENGCLKITSGVAPTLSTTSLSVVTSVTADAIE